MRPLYIFDLDGTLALIEHRRHLVDAKCGTCLGSGVIRFGSRLPDIVDGTEVCKDCSGSGKEKPDWSAFFAACPLDAPNRPVISTLHQLVRSRADVWIWSGRSAAVMNETLAWLHTHVCTDERVDPDKLQLCMRREGDHTPDDELKAAWLDAMAPKDRERLVAVFDDRQKVVEMWRAKGVACFQVAPGDF